MASTAGIVPLGPYILRTQSGRLLKANEVASEVINLTLTPEGTLRSVIGPVALVDNKYELTTTGAESRGVAVGPVAVIRGDVTRPKSTPATLGAEYSVGPVIKYPEPFHGVYHAMLRDGQRDVLLIHAGDEIWEFTGWHRGWRKLIAKDASTLTRISAFLVNDTQPQFPTQFESTGNGIVIVPQDGRAYYYDGRTIAPLGFSTVPGAPSPKGPSDSRIAANKDETKDIANGGVNDVGYSHDSTNLNVFRQYYYASMSKGFGTGRVGTLSPMSYDGSGYDNLTTDGVTGVSVTAGWLQRGEYRCRAQFVDVFGNLSAMSEPSDPVTISFQPSAIPKGKENYDKSSVQKVDGLRKQIAWTNIPKGPSHCVGRNLYRTKDIIADGDTTFYRHTQNTQGLLSDFATLPDNITTAYPDNIPDAFLSRPAVDIVPVPRFKLCRFAFGRLWIAGIKRDEGLLRASVPGRYGTFAASDALYPDPSGGEITGLARVTQGLLVFTRSSTFAVTAADNGFTTTTLSSEIGCVAPSSIATTSAGLTIWLGEDGFYAYDGTSVTYLSQDLRKLFDQLTSSRTMQATACYDLTKQEYRCWVSMNGSPRNNLCLIYDNTGWRKRTDMEAVDVCTTKDHRSYTIAVGKVAGDDNSHHGPYVLDHAPNPNDPDFNKVIDEREFVLETTWMQANESLIRSSARVVNLWLRETEDSDVKVEVLRDWRNTTIETATAKKYSGSDAPNFYNDTKLGAKNAKFVNRRPYWTRVQVYVSSSETFKFRIKGTGDWEFIALQVEVTPKQFGGAQVPP